MRLEVGKEKEKFTPVTLTITCETQEELDFFAKLFNYTAFNRYTGGWEGKLWEEFKKFKVNMDEPAKFFRELVK